MMRTSGIGNLPPASNNRGTTHRKQGALAGLHAPRVLHRLGELVHDLVLLEGLDAEALHHARQAEGGALAVAERLAVGEALQ